jgi:hypothetical protein
MLKRKTNTKIRHKVIKKDLLLSPGILIYRSAVSFYLDLYKGDGKTTIITPLRKQASNYNEKICIQLGLSLISLKPEIAILNENYKFYTSNLDDDRYEVH